jgi:hypothetical protein
MSDGDSKINLEENFCGKSIGKIFDVGHVLQPFRFRLGSIPTYFTNRKFVERKFGFVFYFGFFLWSIFFISKIFI